MSGKYVGEAITAAGARAGITIHDTGHSVRAGLATEARRGGHDLTAIAAQRGWAPGSTVLFGYIRIADRPWSPGTAATTTASTAAGAGSAVGERNLATVADVARILANPEHGLTSATRWFSRLAALAVAADALPEGATITPAAAGSDVARRGAANMTGAQLYTTTDVVAAEKTILARGARAIVPETTLGAGGRRRRSRQGCTLSGEQRAALATVMSSRAGIKLIRGEPGNARRRRCAPPGRRGSRPGTPPAPRPPPSPPRTSPPSPASNPGRSRSGCTTSTTTTAWPASACWCWTRRT